jgi:hypothetical protein
MDRLTVARDRMTAAFMEAIEHVGLQGSRVSLELEAATREFREAFAQHRAAHETGSAMKGCEGRWENEV